MKALPPPLSLIALLALAAPSLAHAAPYRAEIVRDTWGIAHITGQTDADAVFGMIYAQAEDDFNRIETNYLTALGRRAEAEGEALLWQDLRQRLWTDPEALKVDYARSPAWLQALMRAWAAGLNQYLADHPAVKPKVLTRFEPWMALSFTEGSIGGDIEDVPLSQLEAFYGGHPKAMTLEERHLTPREPGGSNGIAIGPARSADGKALLLINPHTSFYFRAEQQVTSGEGLHVYGAATWGQFFVYQGFNAQAGWMHTSSPVDTVDEFSESVTPAAGGGFTYRYGGAVRQGTVRPITIAVRQGDGSLATRSFTTYATHHGPITRAENGRWIATALMNRPVPALEQSFLRTKVRDLEGFRKVAALQANSSNNTLFADSKGEIAYFHPQFVPLRAPRFDYTHPVDGSDPATDWKGITPPARLPHVVNPRGGAVVNVNDGPWWAAGAESPKRGDFPAYIDSIGKDPRTAHALRVLAGRRRFTLDSLIDAAYDRWLPSMARLVPLLVAADARHPDPARAGAIALLKGWDHRWSLDSTETTLAITWAEILWPQASAALAARGQDSEGLKVDDWIANETNDSEKLAALDTAIARLTADFGSWKVAWGEVNRFQRLDDAIAPHFDDNKPSIPVAFAPAQWGSLAAFGAHTWPGTRKRYGYKGNSFVAAVEFGARVRARAVTAGGESGDPASPHFTDQAGRYATGNLREVLFWPDQLEGHIESRKTVTGPERP